MPQLSIVVPTFNEAGNVAELRDRVAAALPDIDWEMIYVDDDSPDGTSATVRKELAQRDSRVRCIQPASAGAGFPIGLHRRHVGFLGTVCGGHRRRSATR